MSKTSKIISKKFFIGFLIFNVLFSTFSGSLGAALANTSTAPRSFNSFPDADTVIDTDNDGLSDKLELLLGTDKFNPDTDGDGYGDGLEYKNGYSPLIKAPVAKKLPNNTSVFHKNNSFQFLSLASPLDQTAPLGTLLFPETAEWNLEIAEHLAKRSLLDPTQQDIEDLFNQGSKFAAVNLLFTAPTAGELSDYQNALTEFATRNNENLESSSYMEKLYLFTLMNDPYRAKRKLWLVWEDTFSVDAPINNKNISFSDVKSLHDYIYDNALGNYETLVNSMITNYSMGTYLDLFNVEANRPNENFARELLQLFLMEEYLPLGNDTKNYTEDDVNALAYILTGYKVNDGTKTVYYDAASHNTTDRTFLGQLKNDSATIVNYIFTERAEQISQFIGAKLLRYYVQDDYSQNDLSQIANQLQINNFEIEPTIKWLLNSDIFYDTDAMSSVRYKTPMELICGTYGLFYQNQSITVEPASYYLRNIGFKPYAPESIFGRDGFEENNKWFNSYTTNTWVSLGSKMAFEDNLFSSPWTISNLVPWIASSTQASGKAPIDLINDLENILLFGGDLPSDVETIMTNYLTTDSNGASVTFDPSNTGYQNTYIRGLISMILSQPEYMLISGSENININNNEESADVFQDKGKIVFIKLGGGYDYMSLVAPIGDPSYATFKGSLALEANERIDLGNGYALNNAASDLYPYYTSSELTFVNSVGVPNHSRSHSKATQQMETGLLMTEGAIAKYFKNNSAISSDLISLYNGSPYLFEGTEHISIGRDSMQFKNSAQSDADEREYNFQTIKNIINTRHYPNNTRRNFVDASKLNDVALQNIVDGGNGSAGSNNESQFRFIQSLMNNNLGSVYYVRGNGGYDTHSNQETGFNSRIGTLSTDIKTFYDQAKASGEELTIIVYSEFGRTNRINGNNGTDHGKGGGMVVLSNVFDWPNMIGEMKPSLDQSNWITPRVDTRAVWSSLLGEHFEATPNELFGTSDIIDDFLGTTIPAITKWRTEDVSDTEASFSFEVKDGFFDVSGTGLSNIDISFGSSSNQLNQVATAQQTFSERVTIEFAGLTANTEYFYKISMTDNNGLVAEDVLGSFRTIEIKNQSEVLIGNGQTTGFRINGINEDVVDETIITPIKLTATSSAGSFSLNNLLVSFLANTSIVKLINRTDSPKTWKGSFLAPIIYNAQAFIAANDYIIIGAKKYIQSNLLYLFKIGADTPGISLEFDKAVSVRVPISTNDTVVDILYSVDGQNWEILHEGLAVINGFVTFDTNHFSFFMVAQSSSNNNEEEEEENQEEEENNNSGGDGSSFLPALYIKPKKPYYASVVNVKSNGESLDVYLSLEAGKDVNRMAISAKPEFENINIIPFENEYKLSTGEKNTKFVYVKLYTSYGKSSEVINVPLYYDNPIFTEGALVRTKKVYLIEGNEKHYISPESLSEYKEEDIKDISSSDLRKYKLPWERRKAEGGPYKSGELVRGTWIYIVKNSKLTAIKSIEELNQHKDKNIIDISIEQFDNYQMFGK